MKIYVDADACPNAIRGILFKAAIRTGSELVFVANQSLAVLRHPLIKMVRVGQGFDVADKYIADAVVAADLVITADIPLAAQVIDKEAVALSPRGSLYTGENIKQRLAMRHFMEELRSSGVNTGGPKTMNQRDVQQFANVLDRHLTQIRGK